MNITERDTEPVDGSKSITEKKEEKAANNSLGEEKINKLLYRFAVPSIISMLVGSLYNIVDQFFIGQRVG